MPKASVQWADQATISVTESAANTLTFKKLETGVSIQDRIAWIVTRLEWFHAAFAASIFNGDGDNLTLCLSTSNALASLSQTDANILHMVEISRRDFGTAANAMMVIRPLTIDLSTMPGGGLVLLPNPLYAGAVGSGLASATTNTLRMYYTTQELSDSDFMSLVNARRLISS